MSSFEKLEVSATIPYAAKAAPRESLLSRFLGILCSVRFGIIMLILLGLACLLGMLIMQQNVSGFERYYAELGPAQQVIYGNLGLFDIYHAWYFNAILAVLSLNIILASIDRFPKTWMSVSKPVKTPPLRWLRDLKNTASFVSSDDLSTLKSEIAEKLKTAGFQKTSVSEKDGRSYIFAETGVWNRFGYLAVHVGLLTIFFGGFLTAQFGHTGQLPLSPGQSSNQVNELAFELDQMKQVNKVLPFEVYCTDIQQKLVRNDGPIVSGNSIDWLTTIQIKDESGTHEAVVQMNKPYDYRGYRFFQSSFVAVGRARNIVIRAKNEGGQSQDLTIKRDGTAALADGTEVKFADFRANFSAGKENLNEDTTSYPNPAAILQIIPTVGTSETAYAFAKNLKDIPIADKAVSGYKFELLDFEKVSEQHILSVQKDPGATIVYFGFALLMTALIAVFFFSHKRVWIVIERGEDGRSDVLIGGNANRNQLKFDENFRNLVSKFKFGGAEEI